MPPPELLVAQRGRPRARRHLWVVVVVSTAPVVVVHVGDGGAGDALRRNNKEINKLTGDIFIRLSLFSIFLSIPTDSQMKLEGFWINKS